VREAVDEDDLGLNDAVFLEMLQEIVPLVLKLHIYNEFMRGRIQLYLN